MATTQQALLLMLVDGTSRPQLFDFILLVYWGKV